MSNCVYWVRKQEHSDVLSEGYIGVSNNFTKRMQAHKRKEGTNVHLHRAVDLYGWDELEKSVIVYGDREYCLDIEQQLRPSVKVGWNLVEGGGDPPTIYGSQPAWRGRKAWNKGKKMPEEHCELLSRVQKKRFESPEARQATSEATKAGMTDEVRQKISEQLKGRRSPMKNKTHTKEARQKISEGLTGRRLSGEHKAKISEGNKGKPKPPISAEHAKNHKAAMQGRHWYNNGVHVVFCREGEQPEGYISGRSCINFKAEKDST